MEENKGTDYEKIKGETLSKISRGNEDPYEELNSEVNILFIAESPPSYSKQKKYFFYICKEAKQTGLTGHLLTPLGIKNGDHESKESRLREFKERGYWLSDLFPEPIEEVQQDEIHDHLDDLETEIEKINPDKIVIVLPKGCFTESSKKEKTRDVCRIYDIDFDKHYIDIQKDISKRITDEIEIKDIKIAPFPVRGKTNYWSDKEVKSFSDWVKSFEDEEGVKIKDWLEIGEDGV